MRKSRTHERFMMSTSIRLIFLNPLYVIFSTGTGVFAGFLGTVYEGSIRNAFPFFLGDGVFSWHAFTFWLAVAIFSATYASTHIAGVIETRGQIEQLEEIIRTLPPESLVVEYNKNWDGICMPALVYALSADAQRQDVVKALDIVLKSIAGLAYNYDRHNKRSKYSVNIMRFSSDLPSYKDRLRFLGKHFSLDGLSGVLVLVDEFSVSYDGSDFYSERLAIDLVLPVPNSGDIRIENKTMFRALPGAPMAFLYKNPVRFGNTDELVRWLDRECDFTAEVKHEVKNYFADMNDRVMSFISLPIFSYENDKVIGVVNIHSNVENILGGKAMDIFVPLLSPFMSIISMLFSKID
jgi:hypothetical protein